MQASKTKLNELQTIISKMPLEVCFVSVLPEFGVRWREVARAVRGSRLPMQPASVARVLRRHAARALAADEVEEIVAKLQLTLVATQERKWHVITLEEPADEEISVGQLVASLATRVDFELRKGRTGRGMRPEVQTVTMGDLLYMSVQLVSECRRGAALYVAAPPGQPVALVSSLGSALLRACVAGLGYKAHSDARLFGRDAASLLRVHDAGGARADHLAVAPQYAPAPLLTQTGIDYTHATYDQQYVESVLGPRPPLLTELVLTTTTSFFDPTKLRKPITLSLRLRCSDVSETLQRWAGRSAIAPTSQLFSLFHKIKSNRIEYTQDDDD